MTQRTGSYKYENVYSVALDKPKPQKSIPQEEWISSIGSLRHVLNEKAKTYVVGFFNGDIKVFSKHDHQELLSVKQLHQDSQIEDLLFLKNDALDKKLLVSIASKPNSELKVSEISHIQGAGKTKQYQFNTIAQSKEEPFY